MIFTAINFTCSSCGAPQRFSPVTGMLRCEFCESLTPINLSDDTIDEYNFNKALNTLQKQKNHAITKEVRCQKCTAIFTLTPYSFSSNCPYCFTPAITEFIQEITPQSLIPFKITKNDAIKRFNSWIDTLWFAPRKFKKHINQSNNMLGYYLPYWTYDSDTTSPYRGMRGTLYYVTVNKVVTDSQGRQRMANIQEARIKWTPVSGVVHNTFDDIIVGASKTISRSILSSLEPWHTKALVPFDEKYLLGFEAEEYTIGLDNGFEVAKAKMSHKIKQHIKIDIGGDQQQILSVQTRHENITYKNVLFPIWTASFTWNNKVYPYAINAQTGKIVGTRPYSYSKIILTVLSIAITIGIGLYYERNGTLEGLMKGYTSFH